MSLHNPTEKRQQNYGKLFKQKSRIQWLQEGDQNTKFFHGVMAARQNRNTIRSLTDSDGNKLTEHSQISNEAINFFQHLIGTKDEQVRGCSKDLLAEILPDSMSNEAGHELIRPVTPEEVKASMFAIDGGKSLGPDGYTSLFFKAAWPVVGDDVVRAVLSFFQTGNLTPAFNSTIIALVPKCCNPNSIKEFRPISCCTVIYKCITKIIVVRLKKILPGIINCNQSAFIPGRSITDNILLAQELV